MTNKEKGGKGKRGESFQCVHWLVPVIPGHSDLSFVPPLGLTCLASVLFNNVLFKLTVLTV